MRKMNLKRITLPILAGLGLLLAIAWMAGMFSTKVAPDTLTLPGRSVNIAEGSGILAEGSGQQTFTVMLVSVPRMESMPAGIRARETTVIASRIMARIEKIHVRAGDMVKRGTPLVNLENSALTTQIALAKARIASIQALLDEAVSTLQRTQNLKQQGLSSISDLDKAQANFSRLNSDLQAANQAEKEAVTALGYSEILSPIDGRIVDRSAEPGSMAVPGQTLLSLYNPLSLLVEADVREALAVNLTLGQSVTIRLDTLNQVIPATVSEMVPAADPNARSFIVKADIQFYEKLRPGMFARMDIELEDVELLLIPYEYVHSYGQLDMVWVSSNKQLNRRFVRLGQQVGAGIEVISGLEPGEVIAL
ncbi:MAG: membrane fusion protein (multidrug efflux system) [Paraglaciecola sp.]|jgi:membrane fusion protein (multidrug efflux system)